MGSELQRVTGLLGAQKQGRQHFSLTAVEPLVINTLFFGIRTSHCLVVHDVQDVAELLLIMVMSTHHAVNIPPTLEREPQQKTKTENAFLKAYVEFTLSYN